MSGPSQLAQLNTKLSLKLVYIRLSTNVMSIKPAVFALKQDSKFSVVPIIQQLK